MIKDKSPFSSPIYDEKTFRGVVLEKELRIKSRDTKGGDEDTEHFPTGVSKSGCFNGGEFNRGYFGFSAS